MIGLLSECSSGVDCCCMSRVAVSMGLRWVMVKLHNDVKMVTLYFAHCALTCALR